MRVQSSSGLICAMHDWYPRLKFLRRRFQPWSSSALQCPTTPHLVQKSVRNCDLNKHHISTIHTRSRSNAGIAPCAPKSKGIMGFVPDSEPVSVRYPLNQVNKE